MPVDEGVEPEPAGLVLGSGVDDPGADFGVTTDDGIGRSGGTRCSSAACGLGETTDTDAGGAVEQAQSRLIEASAPSSNFVDRITFLPCKLIDFVVGQLQRY